MDLSSVEPFPDLPTDVARYLLELAAWEDPCTALSLTRVSKAVRRWIDPILHRTIDIRTWSKLHALHRSMRSRNDSMFFARHVKILRIGDYKEGDLDIPPTLNPEEVFWNESEATAHVLRTCRCLERLAFWVSTGSQGLQNYFATSGSCIRLTHLSVIDVSPMSLDHTTLWPQSLTHLHMEQGHTGNIASDIPWKEIFKACPRLKGIFLSGIDVTFSFLTGELPAIMEEPLSALPRTVTTFVILVEDRDSEDRVDAVGLRRAVEALIEASRCVVVITDEEDAYQSVPSIYHLPQGYTLESDWGHCRERMDTWEFADRCIAERERKRLEQCGKQQV